MTNLASIRPNFIVKDLQVSIAYYRERLGFQLDFQGPEDGPFWAGVSRDGVGIMLKAVAPDVPMPTGMSSSSISSVTSDSLLPTASGAQRRRAPLPQA